MSYPSKNQFNSSVSSLDKEGTQLQAMADRTVSPILETHQKENRKFAPQEIVGNCYQVVKQLEQAQSTTVYLVEDQQDKDNSLYVLELIYDGNLTSKTISQEAFRQQVGFIKKLSTHVQIPKLFDHFIENNRYYIVYEYIKGEVLDSIVKYRNLNEAETVSILQDIARIYDFALKNQIVKFELFPENILQSQSTQRYVLSNLKKLFWSKASTVPLTPKQRLVLFRKQLERLGKMVIRSLIGQYKDSSVANQKLPVDWHTQINVSPRLQTILARMIAIPGCNLYNSLQEITNDFQPLLRIYQVIGDKYRLIRYLGEKDGIKTYLARNMREKELYSSLLIVKQFTINNCDRQSPENRIDNLERQIKQLQQLPDIKVIDLVREQGEDREELYLVRSYIEGISLTKQLNQQQGFCPQEAISLLKNTLEILSIIHQRRLIHRNIKPSNLIFSTQDKAVVLVDFGILQSISKSNQSISQYNKSRNPPEQIVGRPTISSDIYALGITIIEALTRLPIQEIPQNSSLGKKIWQEKLINHSFLIPIIEKMICPDVEKRYQSTEEVLQDLQKYQDNNPRKIARNQPLNFKDKLLSLIKPKKRWLTAIASTVCLLGGLELANPVIRPQYHVHQGTQHLEIQPEKALAAFNAALKLQPDKISALQGKADALLALQKFVPALEAYEQAIAIDPDSPASWQGKGDVFYHAREFERALTAYNRVLELESQNIAALTQKGKILALLSRYQEALLVQNKALEEDSVVDVELLSDAASSALALNKNYQALNILERVQSMAPLKPYLWQDKVIVLGNLQRSEAALGSAKLVLESYEQALNKEPKNIELWLGKGAFLSQLKRHSQALNTYQEAIAINPHSYLAWLGMSKVFWKMEQYPDAFQAIEKALEIEPQSFTAWHIRGTILQQGQQDLEQALASYNRAIELNQDFFPAWRDRSSVLMTQDNYSQAVKSLQTAVTLAPQDIQSWLSLSNAFEKMAKIEEALKAIDQVIFLQPRNSDHWLQKGSLREEQQKYTKACNTYRQAMKIAPDLKIIRAMQRVGCSS